MPVPAHQSSTNGSSPSALQGGRQPGVGEHLKLCAHKPSGFDPDGANGLNWPLCGAQRTAGAESLAGLNVLICFGIN